MTPLFSIAYNYTSVQRDHTASQEPSLLLLLLPLLRRNMGEGNINKHESSRAEDEDELFDSVSGDSSSSFSSSSSSELTEDTATSSSSSQGLSPVSPKSSNGPLYELSSLIEQLPVKRGLSRHYQGKSQSFTSLSNARCLEDLPKKEMTFRRKMKPSKSYGGGLDQTQKPNFAPGPCNKTIAKKPSRASCASLGGRRSSSSSPLCCSKPPPIPFHR